MRAAHELIDLEEALRAEGKKLLDEADEAERLATELRARAAQRFRQAAQLTCEREAPRSGESPEAGAYEGAMHVKAGTILPSGEYRYVKKPTH